MKKTTANNLRLAIVGLLMIGGFLFFFVFLFMESVRRQAPDGKMPPWQDRLSDWTHTPTPFPSLTEEEAMSDGDVMVLTADSLDALSALVRESNKEGFYIYEFGSQRLRWDSDKAKIVICYQIKVRRRK